MNRRKFFTRLFAASGVLALGKLLPVAKTSKYRTYLPVAKTIQYRTYILPEHKYRPVPVHPIHPLDVAALLATRDLTLLEVSEREDNDGIPSGCFRFEGKYYYQTTDVPAKMGLYA